jgi:rubrerythrin
MSLSPIDVIRMALEKEKEAVQEYNEFAKTAEEPDIRDMFLFLVEEEKKHVKLLQDEIEKEVYQEM